MYYLKKLILEKGIWENVNGAHFGIGFVFIAIRIFLILRFYSPSGG